VLVLLNTHAGRGRAALRWEKVGKALRERVGAFEEESARSIEGASESVRRAYDRGERVFVAGGGDGTVNLLVNAIMSLEDRRDVTLGAVGLGSSNDFHKPLTENSFVEGVPTRLDCARALPSDVIRIDFEGRDGISRIRYAILNASLGITAEANASFNSPSRLVRAAGRVSVDAAIVASVLTTLATYHDISCRIAIDGTDEGTFSVSNLGIIKSPHFAGSFCYDTPVEPDDGVLGVNLCERLSPPQVLATLAALRRRRFAGRPKTRSWVGERVSVDAERVFALEADGEIVHALRAEFSVLPKMIRCCL
jgi:diacylglycerol kinase (ATP)